MFEHRLKITAGVPPGQTTHFDNAHGSQGIHIVLCRRQVVNLIRHSDQHLQGEAMLWSAQQAACG